MFRPRRLATCLLPLLGTLAVDHARAQGIEYDVTILGKVPGSYITYTSGLNDQGEVVGMAMFIPGGLKGYLWTPSAGYTLLPAPPGNPDFGAVDINNAGVIGGDGGGDGGEIWRYTNGTYEMLGVLSGLPIPQAVGISATGSVAGTCFGNQFYTPHHSFVAAVGSPMVSILDHSNAYDINDLDQVTGRAPGSVAYRNTPGVGVLLLPPLGGKFLTAGYGINNAGNVVGYAESLAQHSDVPFFYSDAGGMQEIGNFGGRAFAGDVNDHDEVIGEVEPTSGTWAGVRRPWVWDAASGVRYLNDVIDPTLNAHPKNVRAINNAGQILTRGSANGENGPILLTPISGGPTSYCATSPNSAGSGALMGSSGSTSVSANTFTLSASGAVPAQNGLFIYSPTQAQTPFGDGFLCVAAPVLRLTPVVLIDGQGDVSRPLDFPSLPSGGAIQPGSTWNFQLWYRDPLGPVGSGFNLSNGLSATFLP